MSFPVYERQLKCNIFPGFVNTSEVDLREAGKLVNFDAAF